VSQHKEQQGFLTLAINSAEVNYLELAYLQALNIKATQTHNSYAVIVDRLTEELIEERHRRVFDYIIPVNYDAVNPFSIEVSVFNSTPFKETIKLESDLLFTRSIDHWWTAFRLKDVCLSTGALTYLSLPGTVRKYRQLFDDNNLPDVYNGLMYFRYSQTAADFFRAAAMIFDHWDEVVCNFKQMDQAPTTDVVYAIATLMMGKEAVTMPSMDFLNFVHMKSGFNGWSDARSWLETVMNERDGDVIRINNTNQYHPVHYYDKTYATQELIKYYEQRVLG
jgi:hypothetical protein